MHVLNVAVQNLCLCTPASLCSTSICCCSSLSVLHTISNLYDFSKDYLITFLCLTCDQEFLILKFGDKILLICQTKLVTFLLISAVLSNLLFQAYQTFLWRITGGCNQSPVYIFTKQSKLFPGNLLLTFQLRKG